MNLKYNNILNNINKNKIIYKFNEIKYVYNKKYKELIYLLHDFKLNINVLTDEYKKIYEKDKKNIIKNIFKK